MVFLNDKKYSCEACIKGHRSSSCKHTDRPLFEIKKKGRPVTQCEHCRELRKTKQVHVKCICESKPPALEEKGKKGSLKKALASAAYPNGLPPSAEVAAVRPLSEPSSDSEHSNASHACSCKDGKDCHCFTTKRHGRRKDATSDPGPSSFHLTPLSAGRGSTNLRPVLPKPPQPPSVTNDDTTVLAPRPHLPRSTHGSSFFSPYGRAYNDHFTVDALSDSNIFDLSSLSDQSCANKSSVDSRLSASLPSTNPFSDTSPWPLQRLAAPACACGDGCECPGCVEHRGASAWFTRECANPGVCSTCFTCLTNSRPALPPAPTPPTTPLGTRPSREFEQWMDGVTGATPAFFPDFNMTDLQSLSQEGSVQPTSSITLDLMSLPPHCTGLCAPGQCTCSPDQRDISPFFDTRLDTAMLSNPFDLDMDMSSFSLPDMTPRGRSSSFPYYVEGETDNLRGAYPKASSMTSLLPLPPTTGNNASTMARAFPSEASSNRVNQPRTSVSQSTPRKSGSTRVPSLFYEAAVARIS